VHRLFAPDLPDETRRFAGRNRYCSIVLARIGQRSTAVAARFRPVDTRARMPAVD
jgi:hypothetical protein